MKSIFLLIIILTGSLSVHSLQAQNEDEDFTYGSELIWGINKNTNSGLIGGVMAKYGRAKTNTVYETFGIEIVNVKHPKEQRYGSSGFGNLFILGKSNYLYSVRLQYGRDVVLFRKAPQQGVQVSGVFSGGPTIGLYAPYFVRIGNNADDPYSNNLEQYDPFNPTHTFGNIQGTGGFFRGITESSLLIGANVKAGLSFEFGTFKNNVTGIETGLMLEAFPNEVVLVPTAENRAVFTSAYITLFYGSRR